jgi:lysophospholipase L1-like esterase
MQPCRTWRLLVGFLGLALILSMLANLWLVQRTRHYARLFYISRLEPLSIQAYPVTMDTQIDSGAEAPVRVVFFGDSRARQWTLPTQNAEYTFLNRGVDGETSAQALRRFAAHVPATRPDFVVIQLGANDMMAVSLLQEDRERIIADCQRNIAEIVEQSRQLGATVILTTIFPLGTLPIEQRFLGTTAVQSAIQEVNTFIASLAADDVIVFDTAALLSDSGGRIQPAYQNDFLHVNEPAYMALNVELMRILQQYR